MRFYLVATFPANVGLGRVKVLEVCEKILKTLCKCKVDTIAPLSSFIMSSEDPYLKELMQMTEKTPAESTLKARQQAMQHMAKIGGRISCCMPPPKTRNSPWYQPLPQRQKLTLGQKMAEVKGVKRCDIGQGLGRQPWTTDDFVPSLFHGSKIWMCDDTAVPQRCLVGREMLSSGFSLST